MRNKALIPVLFAFVFLPVRADNLENGFYRVSDEPTQLSATTLDGSSLFLGDKVADSIKGGKLVSETNDNSSYQLQIFRNASSSDDNGHLALVLDRKCCRFGSWGGDATHDNLEASVTDPTFLASVAAYLKISPEKRSHPGHQFTARFLVDANGYAFADPVGATFRLTNCGTQPFWIEQPSLPFGMLDVFSFTAYGWGPEWNVKNNAVWNRPYCPSPIDMITQKIELEPGESRSIPVNLGDYLAFNKKGSYWIRGTYAFKVMDPGAPYRVLWDDFATAEFQVKIK